VAVIVKIVDVCRTTKGSFRILWEYKHHFHRFRNCRTNPMQTDQ